MSYLTPQTGIPPPALECKRRRLMRFFKHPEQMAPGSLWRVRGEEGLMHLEDEYTIGMHFHGWVSYRAGLRVTQMPELTFDLETIYLLVDLVERPSGMLEATFITHEKVCQRALYKSFWDKAFELVGETSNPKEEKRHKLFGKYTLEEVEALLKKG